LLHETGPSTQHGLGASAHSFVRIGSTMAVPRASA
jgi:hypothetical protein